VFYLFICYKSNCGNSRDTRTSHRRLARWQYGSARCICRRSYVQTVARSQKHYFVSSRL